MHRTRALLALPLVLLVLAACSSSTGASAAAPSTQAATLPGTIWTVVSVGGEFVDATNPPTIVPFEPRKIPS